MKTHNLKIRREYFNAVMSEDKKFEYRINDRDFRRGDRVNLHEWDGKNYTGRHLVDFEIGYILRLPDGHCIFSLCGTPDYRESMI